jgi:hypothetical protein
MCKHEIVMKFVCGAPYIGQPRSQAVNNFFHEFLAIGPVAHDRDLCILVEGIEENVDFFLLGFDVEMGDACCP